MSEDYRIMKERPAQERPYELCEHYGPGMLSDSQLLAVILQSGRPGETVQDLAGRVLYGNGRKGLAGLYSLSLQELREIPGIGRVKAIQIKCIGELARRIWAQKKGEKRVLSDPVTVAEHYMEYLRHLDQERVVVVLLDNRNVFIDDVVLSQGTVSSAIVSPRDVFIAALSRRAVKVVLLHNHPSGDPMPSGEDAVFTDRIRACGEMLDIRLADHIIIGDGTYFSFRQEGLLAGENT